MALFIGLHTLHEDMGGGWDGYKKTCERLGARAVCSYVSAERGLAWCVTEAGSKDAVLRAHKDARIPVDDVLEVDYAE